MRCTRSAKVCYGFGDASGPGYGSTVQVSGAPEIVAAFGQWVQSIRLGRSSNWRETCNFVLLLEEMGRQGLLQGVELIMGTDNTTFENCFYKGYSKSEELDKLIFRLHLLGSSMCRNSFMNQSVFA